MGVSENRGTLFGGPYNKDPTIYGTILGSPIFGNSHIKVHSALPIGPKVAPFGGSYLDFYKVIPKKELLWAYG